MPYMVRLGGGDRWSVFFSFLPPISIDELRPLVRPWPNSMSPLPSSTILKVVMPEAGALPDFFGYSVGPLILSTAAKTLLEQLEPKTHSFSAIQVLDQATEQGLGTFHILAPPPEINAVVPERTEWLNGQVGDFPMEGRIALRADAIQRRHLWREVPPLQFRYFCSDDFRHHVETHELIGLDFRRRCVTDSS